MCEPSSTGKEAYGQCAGATASLEGIDSAGEELWTKVMEWFFIRADGVIFEHKSGKKKIPHLGSLRLILFQHRLAQ